MMHETQALSLMSALAQPTRFKVVGLLARVGDVGMASGDIADAIDVSRHLMSAHLAVLSRAGVVTTRKTGRTVTYSVRDQVILDLTEYLALVVSPNRSI